MFESLLLYIITVIKVIIAISNGTTAVTPIENNVIDVTVDPMNGNAAYCYVATPNVLIAEPETPENRGLVFDGWYVDGRKWDFKEDIVTEDITLKAKWTFSDAIFENDINSLTRAEGTDVRVMSFNILASDWNNKPAVAGRDTLFLDVIDRYKPDVIGMQEVNAEWYESLGKSFGTYRFVNEKYNKILGKVNYSTIAYNTETVKLISYGQKPYIVNYNENCRNLMWAIFESKAEPGKRFIVTTTHWDLTSERRIAQAFDMTGVLKLLENKYNLPMFCTGDYNAREPSDEYYAFMQCSQFKSSKYSAAEKGLVASTSHLGDGTGSKDDYTSGYWKLGPESYRQNQINTVQSIDHIFVSLDVDVLYYDTIVDSTSLSTSDHCPIYIDAAIS